MPTLASAGTLTVVGPGDVTVSLSGSAVTTYAGTMSVSASFTRSTAAFWQAADFDQAQDRARAFDRDRLVLPLMLATRIRADGTEEDVPLTHVHVGDTLVVTGGRYDPAEVLALIEQHRINRWTAVPTMVSRLLDHPDISHRDLSSLKSISIGGAPVHAELMQRMRSSLPSVSPRIPTGYGLTENGGQATGSAGSEKVELLGSTGKPMPQ